MAIAWLANPKIAVVAWEKKLLSGLRACIVVSGAVHFVRVCFTSSGNATVLCPLLCVRKSHQIRLIVCSRLMLC